MKKLILALAALVAFWPATAAPTHKPSLRGSHQSLVHQNKVADRLDLSRLHERDLVKFKRAGLLVALPTGKTVRIDPRLPVKYRYVRPMTRRFIVSISAAYYARFHEPLWINSAARTIEYQGALIRRNGNAARGDSHWTLSSHLTGATVDFGKKRMSSTQIAWMRKRLKLNEKVARAEATEEFRQSVFHVMVFR